jgi:monoamine oxidase
MDRSMDREFEAYDEIEPSSEADAYDEAEFAQASLLEEALASEHPVAAVFSLPRLALDAMAKGGWATAIAIAIGAGLRDVNQLTNMVFWFRHPQLIGQKLGADQRALAREWLQIRDQVVKPALAGGMPKPDSPSKECLARAASLKVAVVGGGLGGLMAARMLARWGVKVTVYEARAQVGGRVLSDSTFAKGRIIEAGAELIGSIHTRGCALAKEYGISLISRMNGDLYRNQQLQQRVILDQLLKPEEIADLEEQMRKRVLQPMAEFASRSIPSGTESKPWTQPNLVSLDRTSVADALEKRFGVSRTERLWRAMELFLVNNNVSRLEHMNFLALLCLVRGGQTERRAGKPVTLAEKPSMGYWDELETYRCGDGCQRLAQLIAAEVHARKGCRVIRNMGVRRIDLRPPGGGVLVTARTTKDTRFDQWLREKIPANPLMDTRRYDCVVFAVPPTVWGDIWS